MAKTKKAAKAKKKCFLVCPIGGEGTPIRTHSDWVLRIVENALDDGYEIVRADKMPRPGPA